jgi:hypothetical protein
MLGFATVVSVYKPGARRGSLGPAAHNLQLPLHLWERVGVRDLRVIVEL